MKYFRVKSKSNGVQMKNSWNLVASELLTEAEIERRKWDKEKLQPHVEEVSLSKKGTYFSFGARFIKSNYVYNQ